MDSHDELARHSGDDALRARGFSLIEVVLALGLLAVVLISISGLFILGARQVASGRSSSQALSIARSMVEEMEGWGFRQLYERFGADGSATSYDFDSRSGAFASAFQRPFQADLEGMIPGAYADVELRSLGAGGSASALNATRAIRILVTVRWNEGTRPRTLELGTVRL